MKLIKLCGHDFEAVIYVRADAISAFERPMGVVYTSVFLLGNFITKVQETPIEIEKMLLEP